MEKKKNVISYALAGVCFLALASLFLPFVRIHMDYFFGEETLKLSLIQVCLGKTGEDAAASAAMLVLILAVGKLAGLGLYLIPVKGSREKAFQTLEIVIWCAVGVVYFFILCALQAKAGEMLDYVGKNILSYLAEGFWIPVMCCGICAAGSAYQLFSVSSERDGCREHMELKAESAECSRMEAAAKTAGQRYDSRIGQLSGISGDYQGAAVCMISGEELILGTDPSKANLLFTGPGISGCHCGIQFQAEENRYYVADYSTSGVFDRDGKPFIKNIATPCPHGTVIRLGKTDQKFILQ